MAELLSRATVAVMIAGWIGFSLGFALRRRAPRGPAAKRDWPSLLGIGLQMVGYSLTFRAQRQPIERPFLGEGIGWQSVFLALTLALAGWAAWMAIGAVRALGKQWSL